MMREAEVLRKIADNIAIKVPLTPAGLKACKALTGDGTMVNVTLCFSAARRCLPRRPAQPSSRLSSADTTMSASTAWP